MRTENLIQNLICYTYSNHNKISKTKTMQLFINKEIINIYKLILP